ncbi:RNA polymerase factor sigma-54 [Halorhodospira abdelmalekii]|uniref:RNA polymerase factor sigma-54 n=1 Tax=Halorhodospira abdelmalekii TaxID=421629 RepID=UPI001907D545|nr:RNA polymerase factor sigma-54 [Halorhodospira abdelmalekii]MBK1734083.1 RNA polymerase factor sigma-54 [Halorhodospira abdelmalekii]
MKQTLQLRIGQQLTMTPQLQQAIRLLQLSTLELRTEIQQALESNVMLELDEEQEWSSDDATATSAESADERSASGSEVIPEELPLDTHWDEIYDTGSHLSRSNETTSSDDLFENRTSESTGLREHLLWQIEMERFDARQRAIAETIVDAISEEGYLTQSLDELQETLPGAWQVTTAELEEVLHQVQRLDPTGVGARSVSEALRVQLEQLPEETPWRTEAHEVILHHLETVAAQQYESLQRSLNLDAEALDQVIELIRSLDPRPGLQVSSSTPDYVIPDVTVFRHNGAWHVELNREMTPRLRINAYYASLIRRADRSADNHCLRTHLQEARWLLKSLRSRNETLLKVASAIVERQQGFLEHGEEAMQPLVLREIAETVEMHESTISRITTNKYLHTPRGTYEFKYFFSSHVATSDGGEASATAIRARIKRLIAAEDPRKPLSDSALVRILQEEEGIQVARRTVAKYREAMAIASSAQRRHTPRKRTTTDRYR